VLTAGALAGSVLYRRRSARRLERVELYGPEGAVVTLAEGSEELARVLSLTRDVLSPPG
jgi:hypothetical protein